jgi:hypothetical protein
LRRESGAGEEAALKRWMVVAAMGLAAVGGLVTPGSARASSSAWYQVYQSGFSGIFNGVAAISTNNIWAVGQADTKAGKPLNEPFIRHYNGKSWQAVTIPGSDGSTSYWVSASASNNVWVGGNKTSGSATSVVYRWNGARWGKVPMPAMTSLVGVVVLAPNNVWAYGDSGSVFDDVFHWNGSRWQYYIAASTNFIPQGISASAANNVWVSGFSYSGRKQVAAAYRWNGSAWHAVSMPHPVLYTGPAITAVSPANVWIGYSTLTKSYALHWDGAHWHTVTAAQYANPWNVTPDGKGGYWFGPQAILTGSTWTSKQTPEVTGGFGWVVRIPGSTSFVMGAGVEPRNSAPEKPTIYRFDL